MESAGFELRWALEALVEAGMPVEGLWMVGGAANSAHWPAILANTTGVPIHLPQYDNWPALGAGILAGYGLELFESIPAGLSHFQKPACEISPDPQIASFYDTCFEGYKNACRASLQQHGRLTHTT
jgi:xylulokinase